jgi:predicted HicB family RNase H-like nuclease
MDARPDDMTDAQLARWQYAPRDELASDEGEAVEVEISPQLSVTISFRLPGAEADAIREAARDAGVSLSEWIRQACAAALEPDEATGRTARSIS